MNLTPKLRGTYSIEQYTFLALVNFQFKIITKIIAHMLTILPRKMVSKHHRGFIMNGYIYECIGITLESINLLDTKSFGGSMNFKIDIKKNL